MRRSNLWFLALAARGRQRRFDLDHNSPLLPARVRVDRQPPFKGQLAGEHQRNARCGRGARTNSRSASRNTRKRAMQDHVKAARARTTFASADYDEGRPCDNPTTAYSPDWSYEARIPATGHPLLREIASPVTAFGTTELQTLIDGMFETMRSGQGIGLAAPQIGVSERIIVFEFAGGSRAPGAPPVPATVPINPVITHSEGSARDWERCFSVPGYRGQVMRYTFIHYVARDFHDHRLEGSGRLSRSNHSTRNRSS